MDAISAKAPAALLQKVNQSDSHDTKKRESATQSAFAAYAFGPMDLQKLSDGQDKKETQSVSGAGLGKNPLGAASLSYVTALQDVGGSDTGTNAKA